MALRSISVFTSPSASSRRVSTPDRLRGNAQYLPLSERFWITFYEDFSDGYYIITSIKFEYIGLPFIDCLAIRHHRSNGFFLLTFSLLTYEGHLSVTRVLLQTKDRKTLFEVEIYISPMTFNFSNIKVFLDRSPDSWFLTCIPLTTLYLQSYSTLLLN